MPGFEDGDALENSFSRPSGTTVGDGDDRDELWRLLEQKDADLRAAAQLGKRAQRGGRSCPSLNSF